MTTETSSVRVGFIGLGNMGAPMAKRLLAWAGGLTVCDVRPEATVPFTQAGARAAADPGALAAETQVICVTVIDDAPVSGGAPGASRGRLAVMVGGTAEAVERVRAPFGCFSDLIVHAGPVGAGTRMKLARNLLHFVAFTAATEAQRLAEAAGLKITDLGTVVRHSDAVTGGPGAIMLRDTTAPVDPDDFWFPIFSHVRDLGEKDLSLAIAVGERLDVPLPLARLALTALAEGLGVTEPDLRGRRTAAQPLPPSR